MAVSWGGVSSVSANQSYISSPVPSGVGVLDGDTFYCFVGQKPTAVNDGYVVAPVTYSTVSPFPEIPSPYSWSSLAAVNPDSGSQDTGGYGATLGAGTGDINFALWTKIGLAAEVGGNCVVESFNDDVTQGVNGFVYSDNGWTITADAAWTAWSAGTTSITATITGLTLDAGDLVLFGMFAPATNAVPFSAPSLSQSGGTFGSATLAVNASTSINNDMSMVLAYAEVTTPGTGDLTVNLTASTGTNARGPVYAVVFHEVDPGSTTGKIHNPSRAFRNVQAQMRAVR